MGPGRPTGGVSGGKCDLSNFAHKHSESSEKSVGLLHLQTPVGMHFLILPMGSP